MLSWRDNTTEVSVLLTFLSTLLEIAIKQKSTTFAISMKKTYHHIILLLLAVLLLSAASSCSTQKNTGMSRWWHSFNARYNTYYNGSVAYIDASLQKEKGNKDNYTELLPLYTIGNKESRKIGESQYETAITKAQKAIKLHSIKKRPEWNKTRRKTERDIEWLNRKEYNPFLWKAWMLMGRSQFYKGSFDEAAATFSYMSRLYKTQPAIYGKARAWLAKCYIEQDWLYDAEDVIRNMQRDSIDWRARKEWDYTLADYYLHTGDMKEAEKYLRKVIKHEMRAVQRAREYYLLGQILAAQGRNGEAYKAFKKVLRQNPPYELEFHARIAMTEVMSSSQAKSKIRRLRSMARSDKNNDFLDQVYYAIGNIYLAERDTMKAIYAYEEGNKKATQQTVERGVLLLHLGDLYWAKERFGDARRCYGEAIGLLDKERKDDQELSYRAKALDELAPHTDNIFLQDSLQTLARMDEKSRNEVIDRIIQALKKKEKEERLAELDKQAQKNAANNPNQNTQSQQPQVQKPQVPGSSSTWYFYNPMAVQQGKQTFQRTWGKRENADDWQRSNKTVVASMTEETEPEELSTDSIATETDVEEKAKEKNDSSALDPHKREYYLAKIPFTEEQLTASNAIIHESLFNAGKIFLDKLDNMQMSEKMLLRLNRECPEFTKNDEVYYYLYLIAARKGNTLKANEYKTALKEQFPEAAMTKQILDPYYEENARYGVHREDSLYADTYLAFKEDNVSTVARNYKISEERYPEGAHRDKFLFVNGLSRLSQGDTEACLDAMNRVVKDFPKSEVATIAGMIINGVNQGRTLKATRFDISDVWNYRNVLTENENDTTEHAFVVNTDENHVFLLTYNPDSLRAEGKGNPENLLLYEIAKHNFSNYLVRNFDIAIEDFQGMHRIVIKGFLNHNEALVYARSLYENSRVKQLATGSRGLVISEKNLELLGKYLSYNDYDEFYEKNIAKDRFEFNKNILNELQVTPEQYDPERISTKEAQEQEETQEGQESQETTVFQDLENSEDFENSEEITTPDFMEFPEAPETQEKPVTNPKATEIPITPETSTEVPEATEKPISPAKTVSEPKKTTESKKTAEVKKSTENKKSSEPKKATETKTTSETKKASEPKNTSEPKKTSQDNPSKTSTAEDDDEYFEFDGF